MSGNGSAERAARVSHEVAMRSHREREEAETRLRTKREREAEEKRQARLAGHLADPEPWMGRKGVASLTATAADGSSARALADRADPSWREKQAEAARRAERRERHRAIEAAENPPPRDPRSSAQKLAAGAGQANLGL